MKRCLVVSGRPAVADPLAASLVGSGFEVDLCARSDEVSSCLNQHLPHAVLVDLHDHLGLRVLTLVESLRLTVPILVLQEGTVWSRPLAFPLSPCLRIYSLGSGDHEWQSQIDEASRSVGRTEPESMFHLSDYVQLAVLNDLSVAMHGRLDPRGDLLVEVVGGDVWNVYAGELEGEPALGETLLSTPRNLEVSLLLSVPTGRQIKTGGWELLGACAEELAVAGKVPPDTSALGTRPLSLKALRGLVEREQETAPAPQTDSFDTLLERGFSAALARDYRSAAEAFEKALELRPGDTRVKFNLDKVRQRLAERG